MHSSYSHVQIHVYLRHMRPQEGAKTGVTLLPSDWEWSAEVNAQTVLSSHKNCWEASLCSPSPEDPWGSHVYCRGTLPATAGTTGGSASLKRQDEATLSLDLLGYVP